MSLTRTDAGIVIRCEICNVYLGLIKDGNINIKLKPVCKNCFVPQKDKNFSSSLEELKKIFGGFK